MQPDTAPLPGFDLFAPVYHSQNSGDWELRIMPLGIVPGYWSPPRLVADMAALIRNGATWMSMSPFELESQEIGVRLSSGHVLIYGLGMGWAAGACAARGEVTRVTVVERDPDVLALHRELDVFAQLPEGARAKLRIVQGDAYFYTPDAAVDLLMPDIWQPVINDGRLDEVRAMQARVDARGIYFWGQELELARHAAAVGRSLDPEQIEATVAETIAQSALPLIGAAYEDYAEKVGAVARRWMRGRWLPGTAAPF